MALRTIACLVVLSLTLLASAHASERDPAYRVLQRYAVGGDGGWDYLTADSARNRLFVTRGNRVSVLDIRNGTLLGEIAHTEGVHGVALAPDLNRGFTSNGRSDSISMFALDTLQAIGDFKTTGANPDAILYDSKTHRVFTFNGRGANATVFAAASGDVVGTIALGGKPEFAVADGKGRVFVNIQDTSELLVLDANKLKVEKRWPLAPGSEPTGLAFDARHARLFAACSNQQMIVLDSHSGKRVAALAIGAGTDAAEYDSERGLVFASNGEGTLTVIRQDDRDHYRIVDNIPTQKSARTMVLDTSSHEIFLAAAEFGPTPAATAEQPRPRPKLMTDSFAILRVGR